MNVLCVFFGHKHTMKFHSDGAYWCRSAGPYDCVCKRRGCTFRWEQTPEGLDALLKSKRSDPRDPMHQAIRRLLSWTTGGACSDCDMFREAPSCIDFVHHKDCAHLEDINDARRLIGHPTEGHHEFDDPVGEMLRLAIERTRTLDKR